MIDYRRQALEAWRALFLRVFTEAAALRARFPRTLPVFGIGTAVVLVAIVALSLWRSGRPGDLPGAIAPGRGEARFLVVCNECHARIRMDEPPTRRLKAERGVLRCPQCNRFAAAWYRAGGSAAPPGGW